jgi:hypothetical protein
MIPAVNSNNQSFWHAQQSRRGGHEVRSATKAQQPQQQLFKQEAQEWTELSMLAI